jgi:cytochrome c biogenesis protein CcdA
VLSLRYTSAPVTRLAYLALYNAMYVVPLAVVVAVFAATFRKVSLSERSAKVLKTISGLLLLLFGALFVASPDALR